MAVYSGITLDKAIDFIISVCIKKGWDSNELAIIELLNLANYELESDSELHFNTQDITTVADQQNYDLDTDMGSVVWAFIVETGDDGYKPLKRATYKQIQASVADDSDAEIDENFTLEDYSHFCIFDNDIYIYRTPDSADYTIHVVATKLMDKVDSTSSYFDIPSELVWGLIYKALEKVAEANGADKSATYYFDKSLIWEQKWKLKAKKLNSNLNQVPPYSLL